VRIYAEWGAPTDQFAVGRELQDFELLIHPVIIIERRTQSGRKPTLPHKQEPPRLQLGTEEATGMNSAQPKPAS
jgi:hypothetical protein